MLTQVDIKIIESDDLSWLTESVLYRNMPSWYVLSIFSKEIIQQINTPITVNVPIFSLTNVILFPQDITSAFNHSKYIYQTLVKDNLLLKNSHTNIEENIKKEANQIFKQYLEIKKIIQNGNLITSADVINLILNSSIKYDNLILPALIEIMIDNEDNLKNIDFFEIDVNNLLKEFVKLSSGNNIKLSLFNKLNKSKYLNKLTNLIYPYLNHTCKIHNLYQKSEEGDIYSIVELFALFNTIKINKKNLFMISDNCILIN